MPTLVLVIGLAAVISVVVSRVGVCASLAWSRRFNAHKREREEATFRASFASEPHPSPGERVQVLTADGELRDGCYLPMTGWFDACTWAPFNSKVVGWRDHPFAKEEDVRDNERAEVVRKILLGEMAGEDERSRRL